MPKITPRERLLVVILFFVFLVYFIAEVRDILLPFITAGIVAYLLNPAVNKLQKYRIPRHISALAMISGFIFCLTLIANILGPVLYKQSIAFFNAFPHYLAQLQTKVEFNFEQFLSNKDFMQHYPDLKDLKDGVSAKLFRYLANLVNNLLNSSLAIIHLMSLIFVTPVVIFYMLRDWDKVLETLRKLLPVKYSKTILEQAHLINKTLSGYLRGQLTVCLILGTFYAIGLNMVGLNFGLFIGLVSGILAFIPYVGVVIGLLSALITAYIQFSDPNKLLLVLMVFGVGQALEGNFITPHFIGNKTGLHPVWLIFGLFAGGSLLGFTGVLLAIPITAVIGVLVKFTVKQYKQSSFYK